MALSSRGKILVFSAPSGAGKTTLLSLLQSRMPNLVYSISATTRQPRTGEVNGRDYFFLSEQEFQEKIQNNEFAEWREVHGNFYGTPCRCVRQTIEDGRNICLDIDVHGKIQFDEVFPENIGFLIVPPSFEELKQRLQHRGTDSPEAIALRLENARNELAVAREKGRYDYTIVNDDLQRAEAELFAIVERVCMVNQ